ncbi:MAG: hypothetical protein ACI8P3_001297 [Saprospiraceae bacterium]|jgi:hypothetical protein
MLSYRPLFKMKIIKSTTADPNFLILEKLLDEELHREYPGEMGQYAPYNKFNTPIQSSFVF